MNPARVSIPAWTGVGIIAALFFTVCLVGSLLSRAYIPAGIFALFCVLAAILILAYGPVQVSEEEIEMFTPLGVYSIRWDQIEKIRLGQSHLIFEGSKVRLIVPQPLFWAGKNKKFVVEALESFSGKTGIVPVLSYSADYQFSKNAKKTA